MLEQWDHHTKILFVAIKVHLPRRMPKYPKCSLMLIKYVQDKITPLLQVTPNNDQQASWDERVERFEGGQEEKSGKEVNLVYFFALWTRSLYRAHPEMMQKLHEAVARDNSVSEAYIPSEQSNFYYLSRNQPVDLTFAVLVIRVILLRARPTVAQSLYTRCLVKWTYTYWNGWNLFWICFRCLKRNYRANAWGTVYPFCLINSMSCVVRGKTGNGPRPRRKLTDAVGYHTSSLTFGFNLLHISWYMCKIKDI